MKKNEWRPIDTILQELRQALEIQLRKELSELNELPSVLNIRILGAIGFVEMKKSVNLAQMHQDLKKQDIRLRPFGKLICDVSIHYQFGRISKVNHYVRKVVAHIRQHYTLKA
jgi:adenosylmethionine-8-amino-7-oxononanoate aminotransferase